MQSQFCSELRQHFSDEYQCIGAVYIEQKAQERILSRLQLYCQNKGQYKMAVYHIGQKSVRGDVIQVFAHQPVIWQGHQGPLPTLFSRHQTRYPHHNNSSS